MPEQRNREEFSSSSNDSNDLTKTEAAPLTAFAAVKERARLAKIRAGQDEQLRDGVPGSRSNVVSEYDPATGGEPDSGSDSGDEESSDSQDGAQVDEQLCSWKPLAVDPTTQLPTNVKSQSNEQITVKLQKHQTITHVGIYDLSVRTGKVKINGVVLAGVPIKSQRVPHRVYAPASHPLPAVEGLADESEVEFRACPGITPIEELEALSPLFCKLWHYTPSHLPRTSFSLIRGSSEDTLRRRLANLVDGGWLSLLDLIYNDSTPAVFISGPKDSRKSTFANMLTNVFISRTKARLAQHKQSPDECAGVFYLDLDPVSPEYTPHGQISLVHVRELNLGPSFTHPIPAATGSHLNELVCSYPLPRDGFVTHTEYAYSCVSHLYACYEDLRTQYPKAPLVINTPSFTKGTYQDEVYFKHLLRTMSYFPSLSHVVYMDTKLLGQGVEKEDAEKEDLEKMDLEKMDLEKMDLEMEDLEKEDLEKEDRKKEDRKKVNRKKVDRKKVDLKKMLEESAFEKHATTHYLRRRRRIRWLARTESDLRNMHMLSYFHNEGINPDTPSELDYFTKPLSFMPPWTLNYDKVAKRTQGFVGIMFLGVKVEPTHHITVLNGALVHIMDSSDPSIHQQYGLLPRNPFGIPYFPESAAGVVEPLQPGTSRLICTALIRGINTEEKTLDLLIPKTSERLLYGLERRSLVLLFGCCEHPNWAYTEDVFWDAMKVRKELRALGEEELVGMYEEAAVPAVPYAGLGKELARFAKLNVVRRQRAFKK